MRVVVAGRVGSGPAGEELQRVTGDRQQCLEGVEIGFGHRLTQCTGPVHGVVNQPGDEQCSIE